MPQIYRRTSVQTPSTSSSNTLEPTDADDSIVLSDLVRTGEASRLRRRGAMRIDHAGREQPEDVREREEDQGGWRAWGDGSGDYEEREPASGGEEEYAYSLYCTGDAHEEPPSHDSMLFHGFDRPASPFKPSAVPLFPPSPSLHSSPPAHTTRHPSGCGSLLHTQAAPRRHLGVWVAKSAAAPAVVALDADYFDKNAVGKLVRSACGCVREGVGCASCGTPLGTRYRPCASASEGLFSTARVPQLCLPPTRPEGPSYTHPPRHSTNSQALYMYTFFEHAVSARAPPRRPNPKPRPVRRNALPAAPAEDALTPTEAVFARILTASPLPISEDEDEAPVLDGEADPDGEMVPGLASPDKSGSEMMLFPER